MLSEEAGRQIALAAFVLPSLIGLSLQLYATALTRHVLGGIFIASFIFGLVYVLHIDALGFLIFGFWTIWLWAPLGILLTGGKVIRPVSDAGQMMGVYAGTAVGLIAGALAYFLWH